MEKTLCRLDNSITISTSYAVHPMKYISLLLLSLFRSMDITVKEGQTGKTLSTTTYLQKGAFPYPSVQEVVSRMFTEMRAKNLLP